MLTRPRAVRRSFVAEVVDRGDGDEARRRWMLLADDETRRSYVETIGGLLPEQAWLLGQPAEVRASYVREVLDALPADGEC